MDLLDNTAQSATPFDLSLVRARLEQNGELGSSEDLTAELIAGGRSNLTFELASPTRRWILRRPPIGHRLHTAHDMHREVTVQRALSGGQVPVPRIVLADNDASHAGGSYYIMDKVEGVVLRTDSDFDAVDYDRRRQLSYAYIDCLAALHTRDYRSLGLQDFGRPNGFLERQIRRWSDQLEASKSRDTTALDQLGRKLAERIPQQSATAIVHGDFRFDNMITTLTDTTAIAAVIDWEMSTLGDPLTDLGLVHLFWSGWQGIDNPIAGTPATHRGYPSFETLADRYTAATGFDTTAMGWYSSFAFYKMAVILEGIHFRYVSGKTVGDGFANIGAMVAPLAERGITTLSHSSPARTSRTRK
jgi:aminoglycoside phosphotransferase (APT) family kinase protein